MNTAALNKMDALASLVESMRRDPTAENVHARCKGARWLIMQLEGDCLAEMRTDAIVNDMEGDAA